MQKPKVEQILYMDGTEKEALKKGWKQITREISSDGEGQPQNVTTKCVIFSRAACDPFNANANHNILVYRFRIQAVRFMKDRTMIASFVHVVDWLK